MASEEEPANKKQKRVLRSVPHEQKLWLLDLHAENPGWSHAKLADKFKEKFGGDTLAPSTLTGWFKTDAVKKVRDVVEKCAKVGAKASTSKRKRTHLIRVKNPDQERRAI